MLVADIMSGDVLEVAPSDNALKTGMIMDRRETGAAAVVEDGQLKGVVSKETFIANIRRVCDAPLESLTVADFMEADVDSVGADDDLSSALELLITQKSIIDRLPVLSDGKVVGWVSKTDFTRLFARDMKGRYRVADLMHYNPETASDYTPLADIVEEIMDLGVKRVMVLSGEKLTGIISVRDLSLMLFREKVTCKGADPLHCLTAEHAMTRNPLTTGKRADAAEAASVMVEKNIGGIPVVNDRLDGIITRTDLLKGYQLSPP